MSLVKDSDKEACKERILAFKDALELLGGKWTLCILQTLSTTSAMKFKDLQASIVGISPKGDPSPGKEQLADHSEPFVGSVGVPQRSDCIKGFAKASTSPGLFQ